MGHEYGIEPTWTKRIDEQNECSGDGRCKYPIQE